MKKLLLVMLLAVPASAQWSSRFDLGETPRPTIAREAHDGNWLAGLTWTPGNIDYAGSSYFSGFHYGIMNAWRVDGGDAATCGVFGVKSPIPSLIASRISSIVGLSNWKPLRYATASLGIDGFGGYRAQHGADVHSLVYGGSMQLTIAFGNQELKAGL